MVIPIEILVLGIGVIIGFQSWIAVKVIEQGRKLVELESGLAAQKSNCIERLQWMRDLEKTMRQVADDTLVIRTRLAEAHRGDRQTDDMKGHLT